MNTRIKIKTKSKRTTILTITCDECNKDFDIIQTSFEQRKNRGKDYCKECLKKINIESLIKVGTAKLKSFSKEEKSKYASDAGKISHIKSPNNKGKFSTDRWNLMTKEDQQIQVKRASDALHFKLNNNQELKEEHYKKIYQNSTIGYISKGQQELFDELYKLDNEFILEHQINAYKIDIFNERLKLCIEFNGDAFHCNPKLYDKNYYSTLIKMTAGEKWKADRMKYNFLIRQNCSIFVVWETEWKNSKEYILNKLINWYNEINKQKTNKKTNML